MPQRTIGQLPLQVLVELAGGLIAIARDRLEAMADDGLDGRGDGLVPGSEPRRGPEPCLDHAAERRAGRAFGAREQPPRRRQLVEDDAERVDVAAGVRAGSSPERLE